MLSNAGINSDELLAKRYERIPNELACPYGALQFDSIPSEGDDEFLSARNHMRVEVESVLGTMNGERSYSFILYDKKTLGTPINISLHISPEGEVELLYEPLGREMYRPHRFRKRVKFCLYAIGFFFKDILHVLDVWKTDHITYPNRKRQAEKYLSRFSKNK